MDNIVLLLSAQKSHARGGKVAPKPRGPTSTSPIVDSQRSRFALLVPISGTLLVTRSPPRPLHKAPTVPLIVLPSSSSLKASIGRVKENEGNPINNPVTLSGNPGKPSLVTKSRRLETHYTITLSSPPATTVSLLGVRTPPIQPSTPRLASIHSLHCLPGTDIQLQPGLGHLESRIAQVKLRPRIPSLRRIAPPKEIPPILLRNPSIER